jgi:ribonuclease HII
MTDTSALYEFDRKLASAGTLAGVDEAGRGPLAGPVVAAAVCLDLSFPIDGINDSKKLSAQKRESLYGQITGGGPAWAGGSASGAEIEELNILQAALLAMERAVCALAAKPALILVDGLYAVPRLGSVPQMPLVKGDGRSASVAAASIVAKVTRDRLMRELAALFPPYEFQVHKGYGTARHRELIGRFGLCQAHRKSFCKNIEHQGVLHGGN